MKKANIDIIIFASLGVLLFFGGLIGAIVWSINDQQKHPEKYWNSCQITCQRMGYKYIKLNHGGLFAKDSCWCLHNGKSERVW